MDIAVIYCRKSDPSAKSTDPAFDQQEAACRKYCEEHGYQVLVARKESYTGTDLANQDLLWECIEDVKHGLAKVVVAYGYDRLSREPQMQDVALYEIEKKYGGRFEAATEQIDQSDPYREAIRSMMGVASSVERRRAVDRMQRGRRDRVLKGALPGAANPKFGYRWVDNTPGGRTAWEVDEQHADTVRRIYDSYEQRKGVRQIARGLNEDAVPTPSQAAMASTDVGKRRVSSTWRHRTVVLILRDPAYCGRMTGYRHSITKEYVMNPTTGIMEHKRVVTLRAESDPERIDLECPAIVSVDQWERVQVILERHKPKEGRPPLDPEVAMMRGFVYCKCGKRMLLLRDRRELWRYRCSNGKNLSDDPAQTCPYGDQSISTVPVNQFAFDDVSSMLAKKGLLRQLLVDKFEDDIPLREVTDNLKRMVAEESAKRDKYLEAIGSAQNPTVLAALVEKAESCSREIEEASEKIGHNMIRLNSIDQKKASFEAFLVLMETWPKDSLYSFPPEQRRLLFRQLGLRIEVSPAKLGSSRLFAQHAEMEDPQFNGTIHEYTAPSGCR